jgi:hypothetical protein
MTTDQPRGGGAEAEVSPPAEPPRTSPAPPASENGAKSSPPAASNGDRRLPVPGAGKPPPGPKLPSGPMPTTPIPGAGKPPTGPTWEPGPTPAASTRSEWERARQGLTEIAKAQPKPADAESKRADAESKAAEAQPTRAEEPLARPKLLPTTRPPGAPPDPWTAFATEAERAPGRFQRGRRRLGRALIHEYALVIYAGLVLAVVLTWPALRYPLHTLPQDVYDPARQAWQVAWLGHVLLDEPVRLWQSNAFYPERYSLAFGSSLLGYAPAGMLGTGMGAAVLRYNILFVLAHALLFIGGYALVRQLGAGRTGAAVAAVAFGYAPWRLAQEGHLDIVSAGGIPLALAMLSRGHGWSMRYGFRPDRRHAGWATAGWLVAVWQVSLGFSLGLPFAYVLGMILVVMVIGVTIRRWRLRHALQPVLGWRLVTADTLGVLILLGVGALIAAPYFRVPATAPGTAEIDFFSPPLRSLLIAPAESRIWGAAHAVPRSSLPWSAEMSLLPGFVLYALALAGLVFSVWKWWQRLLLVLGLAVAVILTLGTGFFGGRWTYLPLFGHLPGSLGVRIPGRLMLWVTLLLAVLAAGAVAELVRRAEHLSAQRMPPWPSPWVRLATFVPLILVLAETINATPHPVAPRQPAAMRGEAGPLLVLPTAEVGDQIAMLWSTTRFQPIANGSGGFAATQQAELRRSVASFPDEGSVQYLREAGVTTVLLVRNRVAGTPWERSGDVPVDALGIRREDLDENTVAFRLS